MRVRLDGETDLAGFRREARTLLARGVPPQDVQWTAGFAEDDLFAGEPAAPALVAAPESPVHVPAAFVQLCESVVLHRDPQRFALLYRLLWRLVHEPALRHDPLDADMLLARDMARAVHRDIHKMHAFVRFRPVPDGDDAADPLHVAWFEPEHHIVAHNAPWFRRRFANMRWAILTPECCVEWDRRQLQFRPGASRADAPPADAGEALWLTYYRSIFNPARLKMAMMQKEMPRKYWRNLPEAQLIAPLAAAAQARSAAMIAQPASAPVRRMPRVIEAAPERAPADSLPALHARTQACRECPIGAMATQSVDGEGPLQPALMFVGEQPGDQEDLRGRRRIHKTPSQQEALACSHWVEEEIALVGPRALVALGATAARSLLGRHVAVLSERGQWHERSDGLRVLVTVHPSSLLRLPPQEQPQAFATFVRDLSLAREEERGAA